MYEELIIKQDDNATIIDIRNFESIELQIMKQDNLKQYIDLSFSLDKENWFPCTKLCENSFYSFEEYVIENSGNYIVDNYYYLYLRISKRNNTDANFTVSIINIITQEDLERLILNEEINEAKQLLQDNGYIVQKECPHIN